MTWQDEAKKKLDTHHQMLTKERDESLRKGDKAQYQNLCLKLSEYSEVRHLLGL
jgi:hypothetical protein